MATATPCTQDFTDGYWSRVPRRHHSSRDGVQLKELLPQAGAAVDGRGEQAVRDSHRTLRRHPRPLAECGQGRRREVGGGSEAPLRRTRERHQAH